jgi:hypothetical protein
VQVEQKASPTARAFFASLFSGKPSSWRASLLTRFFPPVRSWSPTSGSTEERTKSHLSLLSAFTYPAVLSPYTPSPTWSATCPAASAISRRKSHVGLGIHPRTSHLRTSAPPSRCVLWFLGQVRHLTAKAAGCSSSGNSAFAVSVRLPNRLVETQVPYLISPAHHDNHHTVVRYVRPRGDHVQRRL